MGCPVDHHLLFTNNATSLTQVGSNRRIANAAKPLYLSKFFDWFANDFIKHSGFVLEFIMFTLTQNFFRF
jgi:hypothetical protein